MRSAIVLSMLAVLVAAPASAQSFNMQAGPNGFSMQANVPGEAQIDTSMTASSSTTVSSSSEGYSLSYQSNPDGTTLMRVVQPEGAQCQVYDGRALVAEDDVPMSFNAQPDKFYRFVIRLPNGMVWEKKLAAKRAQTGSLAVAAPGVVTTQVVVADPPPPPPPAQVVVHEVHHVHTAPPPPPPAAPAGMNPSDFASLKSAIDGEDFSQQKLDVLRTAAGAAYFTIDQVGQLVDLYDCSNDKVEAGRICSSRIVDRQNAFQLYKHFDFSNDKERVKQIIGQ